MSKEVEYGGGIGFCGLLAILFIALKLTKVITWSWWWVLSPLWIPTAIVLASLLVAGAIAMITVCFLNRRS